MLIETNLSIIENTMSEECMNCIKAYVLKLVQEYHLVPRVVDFTIELRIFGGEDILRNDSMENDGETEIVVDISNK